MRICDVWGGECLLSFTYFVRSLCLFLFLPTKLMEGMSMLFRTMVWAIDLDDGSLIEALGSGLSTPKATVRSGETRSIPCLDSDWQEEEEEEEEEL